MYWAHWAGEGLTFLLMGNISFNVQPTEAEKWHISLHLVLIYTPWGTL
jgi:hypothetical protein